MIQGRDISAQSPNNLETFVSEAQYWVRPVETYMLQEVNKAQVWIVADFVYHCRWQNDDGSIRADHLKRFAFALQSPLARVPR